MILTMTYDTNSLTHVTISEKNLVKDPEVYYFVSNPKSCIFFVFSNKVLWTLKMKSYRFNWLSRKSHNRISIQK